jgi:site-specific DNA-cytosine methylase
MGNAQSRKRYFFVGYRGDKNFNITPPTLPEYQTTVGDIIGLFKDYPVREVNYNRRDSEYQPDDYIRLAPEDKKILPGLLQGESMNVMGRRGGLVGFSDKLAKKWVDRLSDMPFSMHCLLRIRWDGHCPTMSSSCSQYIHPLLDRPLTVRELSALMGWTDGITPAGPLPTAQIAKGICPEVGVWLAEQAVAYLDDAWGRDDWSSSWNHKIGQWEGYEYDDRPLEKVFNLTNFAPERRQALCTTA